MDVERRVQLFEWSNSTCRRWPNSLVNVVVVKALNVLQTTVGSRVVI